MNPDKIYGQSELLKQLKQALNAGRVGSAYLFWGPAGVGKTCVAWEWARDLQGIEKGSDIKMHPDIAVLEPEKEEARIGIVHVRKVIARMSMKPFKGPRKIVLVRRADLLTLEAANALLKTLEEPDTEMVWILTARHVSRVPLTVISRTQVFRVRTLDEKEMIGIFEQEGLALDEAKVLARLSQGSLGRANQIRSEDGIRWKNTLIDNYLVNRPRPGNPAGRVSWKALEALDRFELGRVLDLFAQWFRDLLIVTPPPVSSPQANGLRPFGTDTGGGVTEPGPAVPVVHADRERDLKAQAACLDRHKLVRRIEMVSEFQEMLDQKINTKILVGLMEQHLQ